MIYNRKLRRDVIVIDDIEKIRWFETKQSGVVLGDIPAYLETEITDQIDLDSIELEYEFSLLKTMFPQEPII